MIVPFKRYSIEKVFRSALRYTYTLRDLIDMAPLWMLEADKVNQKANNYYYDLPNLEGNP